MSLREGAEASWVGWGADLVIGDRCRVLSLEPSHAHVRWVTGKRTGSFDMVAADDLVGDLPPARDDDAFTFEVHSGRLVTVACRAIAERGGDGALLTTLRSEGHLDEVRQAVSSSIGELVARLRSDPTMNEVRSDLDDLWPSFERHALRSLLLAALEETES